MAQTLKLNNFSANNILDQTSLSTNIAAGVSALPVGNSANFTDGVPALVGTAGNDTAELIICNNAATGQQISLASVTKLPHNLNEQITALFGDIIKIYRAPANTGSDIGAPPADSSFSLLNTPNGTPLDGAQTLTRYTDLTGGAGFWYKYTFFNSASGAETSLADSQAVAGFSGNHYASLYEIRDEAGFKNAPYVTDDEIARYQANAEAEIDSVIGAVYQLPLPAPTNPLINRIARQLAAGWLMAKQWQTTAPDLAKEGGAKVSDAENMLKELASKEIVLYDASFSDTSMLGANGVSGLPDDAASRNTQLDPYEQRPPNDYMFKSYDIY